MPTELNVIAPYTGGWDSQNEYDGIEARLVRNAPSSWEVILGYDNLADLITKINQLLTIDPDHPCLKTLEITAHGNPISINDMSRVDVNTWAAQLKTLNWCDEASIYLSGCNSGLPRTTRLTNPAQVGPIAKQLANALPYNASSFAHKIKVYGSKGYLSGTHVEGNEDIVDSFTEYNFSWSLPPWSKTRWTKYPGGTNATGNACWASFKNGNW
ncbi:hypothetical protein M0C34_14980 [Agarivorans sp. TSD2052]|uniref:hypothetical protein n=1 Tax=Agarivorans sp. TSD2052 TaxID=2937286 RepID=UPI00200C394C|nr:hypothetical protein [Agarivorans sp. TSD2052]UPW17532.1 hypothetical protein M0C34_14980 [Agarivorans sp. TSD2052]